MFGRIKRLIKNARKFDERRAFREMFSDAVLRAQVIDLNQHQLYELGVDSRGDSLGEYSISTINYWKPAAAAEGRDGRTDHVTLKDTGEFYRSMKVGIRDEGIVVEAATDKQTGDLAITWGPILGLTHESISQIRPEINERLIEALRAQLAK